MRWRFNSSQQFVKFFDLMRRLVIAGIGRTPITMSGSGFLIGFLQVVLRELILLTTPEKKDER